MTTITNLYTGGDLWRPRLALINETGDASVTASTAATGHSASAVRGPQTYSTWSPTSLPGWVKYDWSGTVSVDYVACYVSVPDGCTFTAETWDGAAWVACGTSVSPATAGPIVWLFGARDTDSVRLLITGSGLPFVANLKTGVCTVCPVGIPSGFVPGSISPDDEYSNAMSEGGQILSAQLLRSTITQEVTLDRLEPAWVRDEWADVRTEMRTEGVYFVWNADDYPGEIVYGMVKGTPRATYSSPTFMSVMFSIEGPSA